MKISKVTDEVILRLSKRLITWTIVEIVMDEVVKKKNEKRNKICIIKKWKNKFEVLLKQVSENN